MQLSQSMIMVETIGATTDSQYGVAVTAKIWANFVLASNHATSLRGCSSALSSPEDRRRFHAIRSHAKAIVTGGQTYRGEFYQQTPVPLFVASRDLSPSMKELNPDATILAQPPIDVVTSALMAHGDPVLIEGGALFIGPLLASSFIERLYLTRTDRVGDAHFYQIDLDLAGYLLVESESVADERFEIWELADRNQDHAR